MDQNIIEKESKRAETIKIRPKIRSGVSLNSFEYRSKCELCNSEKKSVLLSKELTDPSVWDFLSEYYHGKIKETDLMGGKHEILKCLSCGFIWQAFILNEEGMGKLYSVWISPENSLRNKNNQGLTLFSGLARQVETISSLIKKKPEEVQVLDFGMGWGHWAIMAKAFGYDVSGFEISKDRIEYVKQYAIHAFQSFSEMNTFKFDFINAEQVFEHIKNPVQTLERLVHHLKEGGIIRIAVPNGNKIEKTLRQDNWKASKDAIHPLEHVNCFTHRTLKKLGQEAGLQFMRQPYIPSNGLLPSIKSFIGQYYRQYFDTVLYFKKLNGFL